MKLYAYCVVKRDAIQSQRMTGLAGGAVYSIESGEVAAIVSDCDGDRVPVTRENILLHQQVVRNVLEISTPLPFRFGALVTRQGLASYLEARHDALRQKLMLVDGCVEMSVKVIWQESLTTQQTEAPEKGTEQEEGMGTAFLQTKSRQIAGDQRRIEAAKEIASWLKTAIAPLVRESSFNIRPTHRLVLAVDCLVEWGQVNSYRLALQKAREERPNLHFLASGPWPPYSFANIDLEFKTHFGVS